MYIYLLIQNFNLSRSTSFMKVFCRLLTHQSFNYFFGLNDYDAITKLSFQSHAIKVACTSFHIGGFLFVRYGHKAWDFLAAYFWFCWLLISFPLHHLFCIALSSPWLVKRRLVYMLLSISEHVHVYAPTFVFAYLAHAKGNMWFMMFTLHHNLQVREMRQKLNNAATALC